jgi:hypothetical protein
MTQEEHRRGSAAVALRRLSHPGRDGRDTGAVVEDHQISEVTRRLSELLAVVEHRPAEDRVRIAASTETVAPAAPVQPAPAPQEDDTGVAMITLRFDTQMLARVDAAAKRLGISRTAWLHLAAAELLKDER